MTDRYSHGQFVFPSSLYENQVFYYLPVCILLFSSRHDDSLLKFLRSFSFVAAYYSSVECSMAY